MSRALAIKQQSMVNGINVDDLTTLIENVKQNPREGLTRGR